MNHLATSKEDILAASRELIKENGWGHILNGLCDILKNDPKIRPDVFDEQFTEKQFADILFSLILVSMIRQDYNPSSILMLINKTLY